MSSFATALSASPIGLEAILVEVEVDLSQQLPAMATVGLAQTEVREAKDRVRAAIRNAGMKFPSRKVTVNLAPADVPKSGTAFDLPIATALLAAAGEISADALAPWVQVGELALDGALRPVAGVLPIALAARRAGRRGLVVPAANADEAAMVSGVEVRIARTLGEVIGFLRAEYELPVKESSLDARLAEAAIGGPDLSFVRGHAIARRALEIAAAGGHNVLLSGPPGAGKTLLARCLPSLLPPLSREEALEVTAIHSVAGLLPGSGIVAQRPFRAPHPSVRPQALLGGGRPLRPGEVSLAHRGVLFLDEFPELDRDVLESLRGPLEDRAVNLARAGRRVAFPASFMLVAAMNPCPCGRGGSARCSCSEYEVKRYRARLSGPLLDRIDLRIEVEALRGDEFEGAAAESSAEVRARVSVAREQAIARAAAAGLSAVVAANAELPREVVEQAAGLDERGRKLLALAVDAGLSARARERTLRLARTIADLGGADRVSDEHLEEALAYRG
ncbi:MAG TPA: YifB family Mg chelatase-like AAA ATPase [bacterium]|nr:YifB family Mg chelatase-like AAA ATPase [bacterium]